MTKRVRATEGWIEGLSHMNLDSLKDRKVQNFRQGMRLKGRMIWRAAWSSDQTAELSVLGQLKLEFPSSAWKFLPHSGCMKTDSIDRGHWNQKWGSSVTKFWEKTFPWLDFFKFVWCTQPCFPMAEGQPNLILGDFCIYSDTA